MKKSVVVFDSGMSINSEHIIVALGKSSEKLSKGTILRSGIGMQWEVVDNDLKFGKSLSQVIQEKESEGIFFYDLKGIEHNTRPDIYQELTVTNDKY
jgi:hypothetical protein